MGLRYGTLVLYAGVKVDPNYQATIDFSSLQEQTSYFNAISNKHQFDNQSYTRVNEGVIRVKCQADTVYDCNYLRIQNDVSGKGAKYFYGFITDVTYVNENTTEVTYEIDVVQTYMFDVSFEDTFIQRWTTKTDYPGDNLQEENLELGEPITLSEDRVDMSSQNVAVLFSENPNGSKVDGSFKSGIYNGLGIKADLGGGNTGDFNFSFYYRRIATDVDGSGDFVGFDTNLWEVTNTGNVYTLQPIRQASGYNIFIDLTIRPVPIEKQQVGTDSWFEVALLKAYNTGGNFTVDYLGSSSDQRLVYNSTTHEYSVQRKSIGPVFSQKNFDCSISDIDWSRTTFYIATDVNEFIKSFNNPSAIVNIYQYPSLFADATERTPATTGMIIYRPVKLTRNYVPKNNKLFTFPYSYLVVSNNVGENITYRFEDSSQFDGSQIKFTIEGTYFGVPTGICYPENYKNKAKAYEDGLYISSFPPCAWLSDVYKQWWAENKNSIITGTISSAVSSLAGGAVASAVGGNPLGLVRGGLAAAGNIANAIAKAQDVKALPNQSKGQAQAEGLGIGLKRVGYSFYVISLKEEFLRIIDNYFSMFGYAYNRLERPEHIGVRNRPTWDYIKTIGCNIHGNIPAVANDKLSKIFDSGITFWHYKSVGFDYGNYSQDNAPVEVVENGQG